MWCHSRHDTAQVVSGYTSDVQGCHEVSSHVERLTLYVNNLTGADAYMLVLDKHALILCNGSPRSFERNIFHLK